MPAKMAKLREMDHEELEAKKGELAEELFRLRFQIASGQMEGLKRYREARRDLARVNTLLGGLRRAAGKEGHGT
ncbi:MAG TPA: 50S ribosomal protein L29 [Patescibacteria group bacterium]|nr:50S ribosomal protein L29 [Patescibacteria group bacterium]